MIIWHQTYGAKNTYNMNKLAYKCLGNNHKIKTVRELKDYIEKCKKYNCQKMAKKLLKHWEINRTQSNVPHIRITWTTFQGGRMPKKKLEIAQPYTTQT